MQHCVLFLNVMLLANHTFLHALTSNVPAYYRITKYQSPVFGRSPLRISVTLRSKSLSSYLIYNVPVLLLSKLTTKRKPNFQYIILDFCSSRSYSQSLIFSHSFQFQISHHREDVQFFISTCYCRYSRDPIPLSKTFDTKIHFICHHKSWHIIWIRSLAPPPNPSPLPLLTIHCELWLDVSTHPFPGIIIIIIIFILHWQ